MKRAMQILIRKGITNSEPAYPAGRQHLFQQKNKM